MASFEILSLKTPCASSRPRARIDLKIFYQRALFALFLVWIILWNVFFIFELEVAQEHIWVNKESQDLIEIMLHILFCKCRDSSIFLFVLWLYEPLNDYLEGWDRYAIVNLEIWENDGEEHEGLVHDNDLRWADSSAFVHHEWQNHGCYTMVIQIFFENALFHLRNCSIPKLQVWDLRIIKTRGIVENQVTELLGNNFSCHRLGVFRGFEQRIVILGVSISQ